MNLNDQELTFAHNLVSGMTIVDAAKGAGYADSTAKKLAWQWIGDNRSEKFKPELFDYIEKLRSEIREGVKNQAIATLDEVLEFQTKVLRTDMSELIEFDGFGSKPKSFDEMGEAVEVIQEINFRKGEGTKIKTYSKMDASEKLIKFYGGYAPVKTELTGKDGAPIQIESKKDYSSLSTEELETLIRLEEKADNE
eukprot:GHVU01076505.1.p2 GENE.GHVU01076505.1~~GHVU01076505.1.p2  ORF type:complete len:195 (-),score=27.44 GHVU01076505.1:542-1126(-)